MPKFAQISIPQSVVTGNEPDVTMMADGELALNRIDGILFYKDASGDLGRFFSASETITIINNELVNLIDDGQTASDKTWSSTKISDELQEKVDDIIDDDQTASDKTWSSTKISDEVNVAAQSVLLQEQFYSTSEKEVITNDWNARKTILAVEFTPKQSNSTLIITVDPTLYITGTRSNSSSITVSGGLVLTENGDIMKSQILCAEALGFNRAQHARSFKTSFNVSNTDPLNFTLECGLIEPPNDTFLYLNQETPWPPLESLPSELLETLSTSITIREIFNT